MVKNLNQLKKALKEGVEFEVVLHTRSECIGQIRRITKVNTSGIYSVIPAEPNSKFSAGNNGFGAFLAWGPARIWTFDSEGLCAQYSDCQYTPNEVLIAFKIIGKEVQNG